MTTFLLGDIKFEPINSPTSFEIREGVNLVEKDRIENKNTIQLVGGVLKKISISVKLHWTFSDVRADWQKLRDAMYAAEPLTFSYGNGVVEGDFLISNMSTPIERTSTNGVLLSITTNLELIESVTDETLDAQALYDRQRAFALVSANPIESRPVPVFPFPPSMVMRNISSATAASASASENVKKAASLPQQAKKYTDMATRNIDRAKAASTSAIAGINTVTDKINNSVALKTNLETVLSSLTGLGGALQNGSVLNALNLSYVLDQNLGALKSASSQLAAVVALRL